MNDAEAIELVLSLLSLKIDYIEQRADEAADLDNGPEANAMTRRACEVGHAFEEVEKLYLWIEQDASQKEKAE